MPIRRMPSQEIQTVNENPTPEEGQHTTGSAASLAGRRRSLTETPTSSVNSPTAST
jgi:hypothetical protein